MLFRDRFENRYADFSTVLFDDDAWDEAPELSNTSCVDLELDEARRFRDDDTDTSGGGTLKPSASLWNAMSHDVDCGRAITAVEEDWLL